MDHLDYALVVEQARQLRAQELQRYQGLFGQRLRLCGRLLAETLLAVLGWLSEGLRPLFSWNPKPY